MNAPNDSAIAGLIDAARQARENAYAPYSGFRVGAALLTADGRIFTGVNVENASYGLTSCAESGAVSSAVGAGIRDFVAIAVTGPDNGVPCTPCGSCRQILHEFAPNLLVITEAASGAVTTPLRELLPQAFGSGNIQRVEGR